MSEFKELVKALSKSREYVRDFYIYGFKSREDFIRRSARTYDNERRRIESWLTPYIKSGYRGNVKNVYLSLNTNMLSTNPLFKVFEAKSFTDNDIRLHFYLIDVLQDNTEMTADELSDSIFDRFGEDIEPQLVRKKANEYTAEGIFTAKKQGKKLLYTLSQDITLSPGAAEALDNCLCFYQLDAPVGFVGYSLMKSRGTDNHLFLIKHGYFAHTLDDEILLSILGAMREHRSVSLKYQSSKPLKNHPSALRQVQSLSCLPLRIFVSTRTGRRFLCVYKIEDRRFFNIRIDHIKKVTLMSENTDYNYYLQKLTDNLPHCFGMSFGGSHVLDEIKLTLSIREPYEQYILTRLETEGRGGKITRIGDNTYTYEIQVFDGNEMMPWIKTFIGRIISFETNNEFLRMKFYRDISQMAKMYDIDGDVSPPR